MVPHRAINLPNKLVTAKLTEPYRTKWRPWVRSKSPGNPKKAMRLCENSKSLSVVGVRRNVASGQLLLWSFDTIKFFLVLVAFLNGPAKSMEFSSLTFSAMGTLPYWPSDWMGLKFLPAFLHSLHTLTESTTSGGYAATKSPITWEVSFCAQGAASGTTFQTLFAELLEPLSDHPCTTNRLDQERKLKNSHFELLGFSEFYVQLVAFWGR